MALSNGTTSASVPTPGATNPAQQQHLSEEEAALLDRQLRLWGVEAQTRMLNSSILVYGFNGVGTEVVKTLVLAGVGNVTVLDHRTVNERDFGCNFFLREQEGDLGKLRVEVGAPRAQLLNPRVNLTTRSDKALLEDEAFLAGFSLVVLTDVDAPTVLRVNALTRKLQRKLYVASSVGLDGWVFADLLQHDFVVDKQKTIAPGETIKVPTKVQLDYVPFDIALSHSFSSLRPRELKRTPDSLWGILALLSAQKSSEGQDADISVDQLQSAASHLLPKLSVKPELLTADTISRIARTAAFEFPPTAAIVGGIAGQDALNIVGGKEEPVRNFMVFDGTTNACNVWQLRL